MRNGFRSHPQYVGPLLDTLLVDMAPQDLSMIEAVFSRGSVRLLKEDALKDCSNTPSCSGKLGCPPFSCLKRGRRLIPKGSRTKDQRILYPEAAQTPFGRLTTPFMLGGGMGPSSGNAPSKGATPRIWVCWVVEKSAQKHDNQFNGLLTAPIYGGDCRLTKLPRIWLRFRTPSSSLDVQPACQVV